MKFRCFFLNILIFTLTLTASVAAGQSDSLVQALISAPLERFKVRAVPVQTPPVIDGALDDECWQNCPAYGNFTQALPVQESAASESTYCYFAYDSENLYLAAVCFDSQPDKVVANVSRRGDIDGDDIIQFTFDTFNDMRSAYDFTLNPYGVQSDGTRTVETSDDSWDAVWESAGRLTDKGWQVEASIPFKNLRYRQQPDQIWRVQVLRLIQRSGEVDCYVPVRKNDNNQLERSAALIGMQSIGGHKLFDITPYVTHKYTKQYMAENYFDEDEIGADIKYGLTSNLTLDATINPDFGHVEADIDQINLSPYELNLQEKRPFFLEKMDIFRTPFNLFYSRRVANPDAGVKMTGQMGKFSLGAFYARDKELATDNKDNYWVGRTEVEIFKQSQIGLMSTYVDKVDGYYNGTVAADWQIIRGPFVLIGQLAKSDTKDVSRLQWNGTSKFRFVRNNILAEYQYMFFEKNFRADAGLINNLVVDLTFAPLSYRTHYFKLSHDWYINRLQTQDISSGLIAYVRHDYNGRLLMRTIYPTVYFGFTNNISLSLNAQFDKKLWENQYFNNYVYSFNFYANPSGYFGGGLYYQEGKTLDYWGVTSVWQKYLSASLVWNPSPSLEINPAVLHLSQYAYQHGPRTYNQWNGVLRIGYHFSSEMFLKVFLQGNGYNDYYTANLLFGYEFSPGSTLYMAYNSDYLYMDKDFDPYDRIVFAKLSILMAL